MCSIAGVTNPDSNQLVNTMLNLMRHRAPDDKGIYKGKKTFYMLKYYIWLDNLLNDKIAEDGDGQIKKRLSPFQIFISTKDAFEKLQIVYFP